MGIKSECSGFFWENLPFFLMIWLIFTTHRTQWTRRGCDWFPFPFNCTFRCTMIFSEGRSSKNELSLTLLMADPFGCAEQVFNMWKCSYLCSPIKTRCVFFLTLISTLRTRWATQPHNLCRLFHFLLTGAQLHPHVCIYTCGRCRYWCVSGTVYRLSCLKPSHLVSRYGLFLDVQIN